jgi:hypothetical protein
MTALVWTCDKCKRPIADGKGAVFVRWSDSKRYEEAKAKHKRKQRALVKAEQERTGKKRVLVAMDLTSMIPMMYAVPHWHVLHHKCDPTPADSRCHYDVSEMRTEADVLARTAHLMGKRWFKDTRWDDLIYRVLAQARS